MAEKQPFKKRIPLACLVFELGGVREMLAGVKSETSFLPQTENMASVHELLF